MKSNENILIVDDDQYSLELLEHILTTHGLTYKTARGGAEALKLLRDENISVMVTDMVMPVMDGMELLIKTKELYPDIDVMVMTRYSKLYSFTDVIDAGATDFISKPFTMGEFIAKTGRIFRERALLMELRAAKEKAEADSKAKTDFLHTISHELITPMNGILGFSGLLSDADLPADEKEYATMLDESAEQLMGLINQILDFSAIDTDGNDPAPCSFNLGKVFEELFILALPRAEKKGLRLELEIDESLSKRLLFGNQLFLQKILNNLIENAIKFTEVGFVKIETKKVRDFEEDFIELQFLIKDTGCGIDPEQQAAIFKPFTQVEEYMTRKHKGVGLGLAICVKLVDKMNGEIWVESSLVKGSEFYFTVQIGLA